MTDKTGKAKHWLELGCVIVVGSLIMAFIGSDWKNFGHVFLMMLIYFPVVTATVIATVSIAQKICARFDLDDDWELWSGIIGCIFTVPIVVRLVMALIK